MHVPRRTKELATELREASESLLHSLNRAPTAAELADLVGVEAGHVLAAIDAAGAFAVVSLDVLAATDDGGGPLLADLIGADDPGLQNVVDRETLRPLLARLLPREKRILLMRFFQGMTQSQIGAELGVSQMQVSRLLTGILDRIRQQSQSPDPVPATVAVATLKQYR